MPEQGERAFGLDYQPLLGKSVPSIRTKMRRSFLFKFIYFFLTSITYADKRYKHRWSRAVFLLDRAFDS